MMTTMMMVMTAVSSNSVYRRNLLIDPQQVSNRKHERILAHKANGISEVSLHNNVLNTI
jgi:hypothetical protein